METNIALETSSSSPSIATLVVDPPPNTSITTTPPEALPETTTLDETIEITTTNDELVPSTTTTTNGTTTEDMEEVTKFGEQSANTTSISTSRTTQEERTTGDPPDANLDGEEAVIPPTVMEKVSVETNPTTTAKDNDENSTELEPSVTTTVEAIVVQESPVLSTTAVSTPIVQEGTGTTEEQPSSTDTATNELDATDDVQDTNIVNDTSTPMDVEESQTTSLKRKVDEI
jgi:hypothetical protein